MLLNMVHALAMHPGNGFVSPLANVTCLSGEHTNMPTKMWKTGGGGEEG